MGAAAAESRPVSRAAAAASGMLAAGAALAAGELVCGLRGGGPTLVTAVGTQFIDRFAASLKDVAIAVFGTNDKAALIVGIVVVSLLLGAGLGVAAVRRPWVGVAGFVAFGAVGLFSYLDASDTTATGVVAAVVGAAVGIAVLFALLRVAGGVEPGGDEPLGADAAAPVATAVPAGSGSRRTFLVAGGATAAGTVIAASLGRRLGSTDVVDTARAATELPPVRAGAGAAAVPATSPSFAVPGLSPYIIPNEDFYRIDTALSTPQVDVGAWELAITGLVARPFTVTYDELVEMATTEDTVTLSCVSNEVGGNLVGNAVWQGVPLAVLLERAGVREGATQIVGRSVDDFTAGFPTAIGLDGRTALVAVGMNGEPLPAAHGFPARLVVAGLYGYVSATKWLREIELTTWEDFDGYWVPRGWSKEGPIKTMSRIDVPRSGASLGAGAQAIAGVAWAPPRGIEKVEVQVDDGGPWVEADLGDATSGNTWVQWKLAWDATPGEHAIRVRATGADGITQTEDAAPPAPDGATGWHRRTVKVS
jgi:DMSO/TMAO reductase YedYZ molybdopterin-dependent catalytic subunit